MRLGKFYVEVLEELLDMGQDHLSVLEGENSGIGSFVLLRDLRVKIVKGRYDDLVHSVLVDPVEGALEHFIELWLSEHQFVLHVAEIRRNGQILHRNKLGELDVEVTDGIHV
jgi:hypothetical protein